MNQKEIIQHLQRMLDMKSSPNTKLWWEKYLRGVIQFRGIGIPEIRKIIAIWRKETGLDHKLIDYELEIALALFEQPIAEDKLAGILYLQYYLYQKFPWEKMFMSYVALYNNKLIFDWNTCDWFCVRILGPTLVTHGEPVAQTLTSWKDSFYLWHARSAVVPFIKVANQQKYYPYIREVCIKLIKIEERFAKTAVGWLLRDVSKHDHTFVERFIKEHSRYFSLESVRNATRYFDNKVRQKLIDLVKTTLTNTS
jgi:3-methyladenine DNA glycosylase AlkD